MHLLRTVDTVDDTDHTHDTYSQDSWSHFWGKFLGRCGNTQIHLLHMIDMVQREREREKLVTFLGQIPGQMWEYTNTFVTYDRYGT